MKKRTACLSALFLAFLIVPWQLAASGITDKPALSQYDVSCDTASIEKGFLYSVEGSGSVDPGFSLEANLGAGFGLSSKFNVKVNVAGGLCGWENDEDHSSETFFYGLAGGKIAYKSGWFSCAVDVRFRLAASTDEMNSPDILFPALLLGIGRKEFLTLGLIGQGVSLTFHWKMLHAGVYFLPPSLFSDFADIGLKVAFGRY